MNGREYIIAKQVAWARSRGIPLIGSKVDRGARIYTTSVEDNLFLPLTPEVRKALESGDGNELGSGRNPGKIQALHSSSALGINVFHYWESIGAVHEIAAACSFCRRGSKVSESVAFEEHNIIDERFDRHPNIDAVIHNAPDSRFMRFAVECKFSEAYGGRAHGGVSPRYLQLEQAWAGLPQLRALAAEISPKDTTFQHLHPAQLIKHILGLKNQVGKTRFRLLYLWYDVPGPDGARHREEISRFAKVTSEDGVRFHALTYQELIVRLLRMCADDHADYVQYLADRYL